MKKFLRPGWLIFFAVLGYALFVGGQVARTYVRTKADSERIRHIVASEELILELNSELGKLSRSVKNLRFPDYQATGVFQDSVLTDDIADPQDAEPLSSLGTMAATIRAWPVGEQQSLDANELSLWRPLLDQVTYFEHAKFYFIRGEFSNEDLTEFVTDVGFKGLARQTNGSWAGVKAKQKLHWVATTDGAEITWKLSEWKTKELRTIESPQLLFTESLASALPEPNAFRRARNSLHEDAVARFYRGGAEKLPWRYFSPISANQRPGLSVVDIDGDGFDDLYIMVRRGRNQLLRNRGDGTFEEVASRWGLDIQDYSSCGIFADFDNDGDPDLLLGRSIAPSLYLENNGRRFEQPSTVGQADVLPRLVVSMSAADYNSDGLLDVYVCTYRPAVMESIISDEGQQHERESESAGNAGGGGGGIDGVAQESRGWTDEFLSPRESAQFKARLVESRKSRDQFGRILDQVGPPNVLLVNRGGGRFEVAPHSPQLALWRNSLQATWADYDEDGDPDLYVANDWADDNLFRNDGTRGFVDVTEEMGTTEFGFAMGVSWGDYDLDGRQDIYVSNMYSKAGRRITAQIAELNPSYGRSVDGNYLYRGMDGGFELVSGLEKPKLTVAEAGWSWGGQFADFDNDGFLDLYVVSGYFTAPDEFASDVDL